MSRKMSTERSFLWHTRFGHPKPPSSAPWKHTSPVVLKVEGPGRKSPKPNHVANRKPGTPMSQPVRMEHYLKRNGSRSTVQGDPEMLVASLTTNQRRRFRKMARRLESE
jgi:hypothetical protein